MVVEPLSFLLNGDIIGWILAVINQGTFGLGFPIAGLTLVGITYLSNHDAGITVAVMNILIFGMGYFGLISKEIASPLEILAVVATAVVTFGLWFKGKV